MVSKARDDLPEPDRPVITTSRSRGISTSMFLRLCSRAPLTTILSIACVTSSGTGKDELGAFKGVAIWPNRLRRVQNYHRAGQEWPKNAARGRRGRSAAPARRARLPFALALL